MSWTKANHLKLWASEHAARATLPLLLRKLVGSVVGKDATVNFPALEQVQRPGFDGLVEASVDHQFVPQGKSVWEMGVSSSPKSKAEKDFEKRDSGTSSEEREETAFIFVTPREWRKKDDWIEEKREASDWKDILVFDCNDLEHWINLCPEVDLWFSALSGRRPDGVDDLLQRWEALRACALHPLSTSVFLCDREGKIDQLVAWKQQPESSLLLQAAGVEDSIDFLTAVAASEQYGPDFENLILVKQLTAWRYLSLSRDPLLLVANEQLELSATDITEAVQHGHHVLVLGSRASAVQTQMLEIQRQQVYRLADELVSCGFDESTAHRFARSSAGSSTILKRMITKHPQTSFPDWAKNEFIDELAPFALLGGWLHLDPNPKIRQPVIFKTNPKIDVTCVEDFTKLQRSDVERIVNRWQRCDQPLFLQFGSSVVVTSREDAWHLLGGAVSAELLERFEGLATLILEENNPAFELEEKDRWMANLHGKSHSLSHELRTGIINTLALMTCFPTAQTPASNIDFKLTATRILNVVLPQGASWQRWATFGNNLPTFAEVNPDFLLGRIEDDIESCDSQLEKLFNANSNPLLGGSLHPGLLWALEVIAWSPEHLLRVTKILGQLVAFEGRLADNYGNRPSNSLQEVFNWWLPHTKATIDGRIEAIEGLFDLDTEVGWKLLARLIPGAHQSISHNTQQPRWRDWAVGWTRESVSKTTHLYAKRISILVLERAELCPKKWASILDGIFRFDSKTTEAAISRLKAIASVNEPSPEQQLLWRTLDTFVRRHESYSDADWSLPSEIISPLKEVRDELTPKDLVAVNLRLFGYRSIYDDTNREEDYGGRRLKLDTRRSEKLGEIVSSEGVSGVFRLVQECDEPHSVGWIVGRENLLPLADLDFKRTVENGSDKEKRFLTAFFQGRFSDRGIGFLADFNVSKITNDQIVFVLFSLPFSRTTWDWMEHHFSKAIQESYWSQVNAHSQANLADVNYVVEKLLAVKRPYQAAEVLYSSSIPPETVALSEPKVMRVLTEGLGGSTEEMIDYSGRSDTTQKLIEFLQGSENVETNDLVKIEWGYLPLLDRHTSEVRPKTLYRVVAETPSFFIDLVKMIYKSECDVESGETDSDPTDLDIRLATNARDLLESLWTIPGTTKDGSIDGTALNKWVNEARELGKKAGREKVTDCSIGKLLACFSRTEKDWPPQEVCQVIEGTKSKELNSSFRTAIYNSRGITGRGPFAGGGLELELADKFHEMANSKRARYPAVAAILESLAEGYTREAKRQDEEADRSRLRR